VSSKLGLVGYLWDRTFHVIQSAPITEEDAERYAAAKVRVVDVESESPDPLQPCYWIPLDAFKPLEATASAPLTELDIKSPKEHNKCDNPDCLIHGHSPRAKLFRERMGLPEPGEDVTGEGA
jgi:hypothetical protein